MKRLNIYIHESIEIALKNLGKQQGRNFSELVREALIDLLNKYNAKS